MSQQLQAGVWLDRAKIALRRGRNDDAGVHLARALAHAEAAQDGPLSADVRFYTGQVAEIRGDWSQARLQYEEQLKSAQQMRNRQAQASALIALGTVEWRAGDLEAARAYYQDSIRFGSGHLRATAQFQLASLLFQREEHERAMEYLTGALHVFNMLGRRQEVAGCHHQMGIIAQALGAWQDAESHFCTSLRLRRELDLPHDIVQSLYLLGRLAHERATLGQAEEYYRQALELAERIGFSRIDTIRRALDSLCTVKG